MNHQIRSATAVSILLVLAALLRADPSTQPTTSPAVQLPKSFKLVSASDKNQPPSTWTRLIDTKWEQQGTGDRAIRFEQIESPIDPKDPGIILTRLPHRDIQVFVPTLNNKDHRLGWRYPPGEEPKNAPDKHGFDWYTLGEMIDPQ